MLCAPPSRSNTPDSIDIGGTDERCERNGTSAAHAVGILRFWTESLGVRIDAPALAVSVMPGLHRHSIALIAGLHPRD